MAQGTAQAGSVGSRRLAAKLHNYHQFSEKSFSTILNFYEFTSYSALLGGYRGPEAIRRFQNLYPANLTARIDVV
jgi:hypothetical protein